MAQSNDPGYHVGALYVGDLKPEVQEQHIWNIFSGYGQILSVKVCRDSTTQASLGYAYVNFRTLEEAEKALSSLNFSPIEGKPCRIMWSMRDPAKRRGNQGNLFLKNIDHNIDSKSLFEAFSVFGPILSCKLATDDNGRSRGFGFIQFYNDTDAELAISKVNGVEFNSKKMMVTKFIPRSQRYGENSTVVPKFTNVFVKNFGNEWDEAALLDMFSKFGKVTSHVVVKDQSGCSRGFGFVNFEKSEDAGKAVKECEDLKTPKGEPVYVGRAMKKSERVEQLRQEFMKKKREQVRKCQDLNLYIKPLDVSITDDQLKELFSKFGTIQSHKIMRDPTGRSRGFGFVCFSTAEEAQAAIKEMNSKIVEGKPLLVTMAQLKEDRKREIQMKRYANNSGPGAVYTGPAMPIIQIPQMNQAYQQIPQFRHPQVVGSQRSVQRSIPNPGVQQVPGQRLPMPYPPVAYQGGVPSYIRPGKVGGPYGGPRPMPHYQKQYPQPPIGYYSQIPETVGGRSMGVPPPSAQTAVNFVSTHVNEDGGNRVQNGGSKKAVSSVPSQQVNEELVNALSRHAKNIFPREQSVERIVQVAYDAMIRNGFDVNSEVDQIEALKGAVNFLNQKEIASSLPGQ